MRTEREVILKIDELEDRGFELKNGGHPNSGEAFFLAAKLLRWVLQPPQLEQYPKCAYCGFNEVVRLKESFGPCKNCSLGHGGEGSPCYHTNPSTMED